MTDPRNLRISEQITTLLFRMNWKHTNLADEIHMSKATLSRKMNGTSPWLATEIIDIEEALHVDSLFEPLPDYDTWNANREWRMMRDDAIDNAPAWNADGGALRARRDSNPKPSDLVSAQVSGLRSETRWTTLRLAQSAVNRSVPHGPVPLTPTLSGPWGPTTTDVVVDLAAYRAQRVAS